MTKINIKPLDGRKIPDPLTGKNLKAEGEPKPKNAFWLRRIKFGEAEEVANLMSVNQNPKNEEGL
jgi:hypothetical protein